MWRQHQKKIIIIAAVIVVLAAAFWYGGNTPGSHGWDPGTETATTNDGQTVLDENTQPEITDNSGQTEGTDENTAQQTLGQSGKSQTGNQSKADKTSTSQNTTQTNTNTGSVEKDPAADKTPAVGNEPTSYSCTISISCATVLANLDYCDPAKTALIPADGWILKPLTVEFYQGENVFNILQRTCKQQGIHLEFSNTPLYNSAYIEGINNLYEFDVGELSGWMYKVNDWFPNYGSSRYELKDGDVVAWVYTCDKGVDVGGSYAAGKQ